MRNSKWIIERLSDYFRELSPTFKGFDETVIVANSYRNQRPRKMDIPPKVIIGEIENTSGYYANDRERTREITIQANVYCSIMNIDGVARYADEAVEYIADLVNEYMVNTLKFKSISTSEAMPSEENPETDCVKVLRYSYIYDKSTNTIYTQ